MPLCYSSAKSEAKFPLNLWKHRGLQKNQGEGMSLRELLFAQDDFATAH